MAKLAAVIVFLLAQAPAVDWERGDRTFDFSGPKMLICPTCEDEEPTLIIHSAEPTDDWTQLRTDPTTQIGHPGAIAWENKGNGRTGWDPVIVYVWWEDDSGGILVNRRTGDVRRCGPPDHTRLRCLVAARPTPKP